MTHCQAKGNPQKQEPSSLKIDVGACACACVCLHPEEKKEERGPFFLSHDIDQQRAVFEVLLSTW